MHLEQLSLITNEECVESNIIPVEATKFLDDETPVEIENNTATGTEHDGDDEDLVRGRHLLLLLLLPATLIYVSFILVRSDLTSKLQISTTTRPISLASRLVDSAKRADT